MFTGASTPVRIGILGAASTKDQPARIVALWQSGYQGVLTAAGGTPIDLQFPPEVCGWDRVLADIHGVVFAGGNTRGPRSFAVEEALCHWCRAHQLPLLAIDEGLHILNTTFGGTLYLDLPRDLPEALQHRHPPEEGLRHAINVVPGTRLAQIYGEGEIAVNSLHRRAVQRVARGFRVSGQALDGVIEALEWEQEGWFALGVQWQPAAATASGLDVQVFRALVEAGRERASKPLRKGRTRRLSIAG